MLKFIKKSFATGIVLMLPIGITLFFVSVMLKYIGEPASRVLFCWLDISAPINSPMSALINAVSIVLVVVIIIAIGVLSQLFLGRLIILITEKIINYVPFVNAIYKTVKQIAETFGKSNNEVFSRTVLIEYPKRGCYALGFLSNEAEGEVQSKTGEVVVCVFVPTTPNPTSGFLLLVPKKSVTELEMSVADGMKLIISGGIVVPPYGKKTTKG